MTFGNVWPILGYRTEETGRPDATHRPAPMQPSPPTPADLRARKGRLDVTYDHIERALADLGHPYKAVRVRKVLKGHEASAPLRSAVEAAFDLIEARRRNARVQREREMVVR